MSKAAEARNVDFLRDYAPGELAEHHYEARTAGRIDIDEADVSDGDLFIVMRLDGLDPMINWRRAAWARTERTSSTRVEGCFLGARQASRCFLGARREDLLDARRVH